MKDSSMGAESARRPGRPKKGSEFRTETAFRRRLDEYIAYCEEKKRIPSLPGFCSHCRITREAFAALKERFPLQYDIAQSTFLDEALNRKAANTGSMMEFLMTLSRMGEDEGADAITVFCDHDAEKDGG